MEKIQPRVKKWQISMGVVSREHENRVSEFSTVPQPLFKFYNASVSGFFLQN